MPIFAVFIAIAALSPAFGVDVWHSRLGPGVIGGSSVLVVGGIVAHLLGADPEPLNATAYAAWLPILFLLGGSVSGMSILQRLFWSEAGVAAMAVVLWLIRGGATIAGPAVTEAVVITVFIQASSLALFKVMVRLREDVQRETQARVVAEAANAAKTNFLARMSHDLRTPLNAIIGFSDLMSREALGAAEAWPRYRGYARDINASGQFLLALIDNVLDIARLESGQVTLDRSQFDLRALLADTVAVHRPAAGVTVEIDVPDHAVDIVADQGAIDRIVHNLLSNAIKYSYGGAVGVRVRSKGRFATIDVWDRGVGITAAEIKRLGEPFYCAGDAFVAQNGPGLGLAIVKNLVELHGGTLLFESELGRGTTVHVRLPLGAVLAADAPAPAEAYSCAPEPEALRRASAAI